MDASKAPFALDADEYGNVRSGQTATRYNWLGGKQRSTESVAGLTLMGVRLYNPSTGRFLSVDPVHGGNRNAYGYPADPITMYDLNGRFAAVAAVGFYATASIWNPLGWIIAGLLGLGIVAYAVYDGSKWLIANKKKATPATSPYWKSLKPYKERTKTNGKSGRKERQYEWDYTHGDVEVYDGNGKHLGSADPMGGHIYKPPVKGRRIKR